MEKQKNSKNLALKLTESAIMVALATILSFIKLFEFPYGGSLTLASMLPILLIAMRYGAPWGIFTGFVYGAVQFALGSTVLSYVTGALSVAAVIVLDYVLAFALVGLGGFTRNMNNKRSALVIGAFIAGFARFICHFVSGITVWAGFSIPTVGAVRYSLAYNATYMLPETLVLIAAAYYIASFIDVTAPKISFVKKKSESKIAVVFKIIAGAVLSAGFLFDIYKVFSLLQDPDTGDFDITQISNVNWILVCIVTGAAVVIALASVLVGKAISGKTKNQ